MLFIFANVFVLDIIMTYECAHLLSTRRARVRVYVSVLSFREHDDYSQKYYYQKRKNVKKKNNKTKRSQQ